MSLFKKNSLAVALMGSLVFSLAALQGCSSDEQNTPGAGGSSGGSHAGSAGKPSTAGTAGKPMAEGGSAGEDVQPSEGGAAGEGGSGGEGGSAPPCDLSFDNNTLTALTDNGGVLPPLP